MEASALFGAIAGLTALILSTSFTVWMKILVSRSFATNDEKLKTHMLEHMKELASVDRRVMDADKCIRILEQSIVRVEALTQNIAEAKEKISQLECIRTELLERLNEYIRRGDFVRDTQTLINQIEIIYKKIDYVDAKIDKLRDAR